MDSGSMAMFTTAEIPSSGLVLERMYDPGSLSHALTHVALSQPALLPCDKASIPVVVLANSKLCFYLSWQYGKVKLKAVHQMGYFCELPRIVQ